MQFRALARFQQAEYNHTDERADKLGESGEEIQDAEVDAGRFAGGGVGRGIIHIAVEVVQAEERGRWGRGCEVILGRGEAAVRGAVGEDRVGCCEAVDLDPHESEWGPACQRPRSGTFC